VSVIVDTGCANISSLKFALERLTGSVTVTDKPETILAAERVFLPGVGTANYAMGVMEQKGLSQVIQQLTQPLLGICLGMQLLTVSSSEGDTDCLNLIPVQVIGLEAQGLRLPHMGWNTLTQRVDHPLFRGIPQDEYFYFVHSYAAGLSEWTLASSEYGNQFSAALAYKNFMGVQFHPERSGKMGSQVLKNFLELSL
jgi:imidazole glycerol-phosphate synthase subunit HisH